MKKRTRKLTLTFESLRNLDSSNPTGGAYSLVNTCQPSCPPTCGIVVGTTNNFAAVTTDGGPFCV